MKTEKARGKIFALTGACLQTCPLIGLLLTFVCVIHWIGLSKAPPLEGNIRQLSTVMAVAQLAFAGGLFLGIIGIALIVIALIRKYREPWFFYFLIIYGLILLVVFPIGSVFGLVFLMTAFLLRHEFIKKVS